MKTLSTLAAIAALALFAPAPAYALTAQEVQSIVGGYTCGGSTCTLQTNGTELRQLPDKVSYGSSSSHGPVSSSCGPSTKAIPMPGGKVFCVADITSYMFKGAGGSSVPGGSKSVPICTTSTAVIGFDNGSFSVDLSSSKADGACVK